LTGWSDGAWVAAPAAPVGAAVAWLPVLVLGLSSSPPQAIRKAVEPAAAATPTNRRRLNALRVVRCQ
jgi:hypothetical protein